MVRCRKRLSCRDGDTQYIPFLFRYLPFLYWSFCVYLTVRACIYSTMRVCNTAAAIQVRPSLRYFRLRLCTEYACPLSCPWEVRGLRSTLCWSGLRFSSLPPSDDDACIARHSEWQQEMLMSHFRPWKRFRLLQTAACALCCAAPACF